MHERCAPANIRAYNKRQREEKSAEILKQRQEKAAEREKQKQETETLRREALAAAKEEASLSVSARFWIAVGRGSVSQTAALLEKGVDVFAVSDGGLTALELAKSRGHWELGAFLCVKQASVRGALSGDMVSQMEVLLGLASGNPKASSVAEVDGSSSLSSSTSSLVEQQSTTPTDPPKRQPRPRQDPKPLREAKPKRETRKQSAEPSSSTDSAEIPKHEGEATEINESNTDSPTAKAPGAALPSEKYWVAVNSGKVDRVLKFINDGVHIDTTNNAGKTGLFTAAEKGHAELVAFFLANGASAEIRNRKGQSPLDVAKTEEVAMALRASQKAPKEDGHKAE